MSGLDPTSRPESLSGADLNKIVFYDVAEDALARTVSFLQDNCGIPHVRLIPYPVVFFILARWFHIHRSTEQATLARLAQWVWRGAMGAAHQRAEVSRMREQVRAIQDDQDEQQSLDRLMTHVGARPPAGWVLERFDQRSARSRIEILALLAAGPRDRFGPVRIRALSTSDRIAREIVPVRDWGSLDHALVRSAANRIVLDTAATGLARELRTWNVEEHEHHGLHDHDSPALLEVLGRDLPGAVEVRGTVEPDDDDDDDDEAGSAHSFAGRLRFSVAGVQPKLSMIRHGDRWMVPAKDQIGDWYVKLAGSQHDDLPAVEAATMSWAHAAGLEVPVHRLVPIEELINVDEAFLGGAAMAFAIERFDRIGGERVHQEDFAQALDILPYDKYGGLGRLAVSYDSLTRLVADACGDDARDIFIERLAFMVARGDHDAHLKNWSFQWPTGELRPRLSPCYDLVATVSWPEFGWSAKDPPDLALPLAGSKSLVDLDAARLRLFATQAKAPDAVERFMAALERAKQAWAGQASQAPARMRSALGEHWARVPVLRSLGGL